MIEQGIAFLPEFEGSLRHYIEVDHFMLQDVALMFNVSRERIRQLMERYNIKIAKNSTRATARVWDDALNRFVSSSRGLLNRTKNRTTAMAITSNRRKERATRIENRRQLVVNSIKKLSIELKREPTWREMACSVGLDVNTIHPSQHAAYVLNMFGFEGNKYNGNKGGADTVQTLWKFRLQTGTKSRGYHYDGRIKPYETPRKC